MPGGYVFQPCPSLAFLLALCSQDSQVTVARAGPGGHGWALTANYQGTNVEVRGVRSVLWVSLVHTLSGRGGAGVGQVKLGEMRKACLLPFFESPCHFYPRELPLFPMETECGGAFAAGCRPLCVQLAVRLGDFE